MELMNDSSCQSMKTVHFILLHPLCAWASNFLIPFRDHTCMSTASVVQCQYVLVKALKVTEIQKAIRVQSRGYEWYLTTEFQKRGLAIETDKSRVFNYS